MNILILGNGFDLLHGFPTKYANFLYYTGMICNRSKMGMYSFYKKEKGSHKLINRFLYEVADKETLDKRQELLAYNIWIEHFFLNEDVIGDNWVDFENEIALVVSTIEKLLLVKPFRETDNINMERLLKTVSSLCNRDTSALVFPNTKSVGEYIGVLEKELERLQVAFQWYLNDCVDYEYISSQIKNKVSDYMLKDFVKKLCVDRVISFNYTNTYQRYYNKSLLSKNYNYIHGGLYKHSDVFDKEYMKTPRIVIGIGESLDDDEKDNSLQFIRFKKYYQRIKCCADNEYIKWLDEIKRQHQDYTLRRNDYKKIERAIRFVKNKNHKRFVYDLLGAKFARKYYHHLYIIGHSLDSTDEDILKTLIVNDNVKTTIYYYDESSLGQMVKNLVKIIGSDELIKRTAGNQQTIFFIKQPSN